MRVPLSVLPAAACAAAMFLCFRMMRHSDTPAAGHTETDDLDSPRREVADLREELARARLERTDPAAADGMRRIIRRASSETAPESRTLSPQTPATSAVAIGHPDG